MRQVIPQMIHRKELIEKIIIRLRAKKNKQGGLLMVSEDIEPELFRLYNLARRKAIRDGKGQ